MQTTPGQPSTNSEANPAASGMSASPVAGTFRLLLALGLAALAGGAAWWFVGRGVEVKAAQVHIGSAAEVVYATGVVEPVIWAKVTAPQRKRIVDICLCEGQPVAKGQVLARLDDAEERAALVEIEARLDRLREDANRINILVERKVASKVTHDEKLTQVREYEARLAAQRDRIADLQLKSPVDGVVLRRDGEVGELTSTGANDVLLWVGQPKPLRIVAEVNEDDIMKVVVGQKVLVRHEGHSEGGLTAKVASITPKGDPQTKTFRVYLGLPDDTPLRIGMSVEANIVAREVARATLVPADALNSGAVQVIADGRLQRTAVSTGIRGARLVEIVTGVGEGELVASPFRPDLPDGERVRASAATVK